MAAPRTEPADRKLHEVAYGPVDAPDEDELRHLEEADEREQEAGGAPAAKPRPEPPDTVEDLLADEGTDEYDDQDAGPLGG